MLSRIAGCAPLWQMPVFDMVFGSSNPTTTIEPSSAEHEDLAADIDGHEPENPPPLIGAAVTSITAYLTRMVAHIPFMKWPGILQKTA